MPEHDFPNIGGAPVVTLARPKPADETSPSFLNAQILPGRGMMTLQIRAWLPGLGEVDLLHSPSLENAREFLDEKIEEFAGNHSYIVGGGILVPFANRIPGRMLPDGRTIETDVLGRKVRLLANAGGGGKRYAMHGLLLASRIDRIKRSTTATEDVLSGSFHAGNFGGHWLSEMEIDFENVLRSDSFTLTITARNVGRERLPVGIGWHPYFELPSGRRGQARMRVPARGRALVNDYAEMLPTGEVVPVAGTAYDFSMPGGKPLGDLFLDDCFVDLQRSADGNAVAEVVDPQAGYGLRIATASPHVKAIQVFGPPDAKFIVLEPQFNWADPFGPQWQPGVDTGMAVLEPGEAAEYSARLELFTP